MKITTAAALALLAFLPLNPSAAGATTIHVPDDYATIKLGVWYAADGDTVIVECGTYYETLIFFDEGVTLLSETGDPSCVTIDGGGTDRVIVVWATSGVVIAGFTITNGYGEVGGGVAVDSSLVTIHDCVFTENVATIEGAGLWCRKSLMDVERCDFTFNDATYTGGGLVFQYGSGYVGDCWFMGNEAQWGGGAGAYWGASPTFTDCTFEENDAVGGETYGGGLYTWDGATVTVTGCGFFRNTSEFCGGGACSDTDCDDTYQSCMFYNNTAQWGGGMYAYGNSDGTVDGCSFQGNSATAGGGVLLEQVSGATLTNCGFMDNTAAEAGGGLTLLASSTGPHDCLFVGNEATYGAAVAVSESSTPTISSCTILLNGSAGVRTSGAGIAVEGGGSAVEVEQTIIGFSQHGEAVLAEPGSTVTLTTCDLFGNAGGDWVGSIASQLALRYNTDADPCLCGVHEDDYSLCADSPCLPANNGASLLIGRYGQGCDACGSPAEPMPWGVIKAMYR